MFKHTEQFYPKSYLLYQDAQQTIMYQGVKMLYLSLY